MRKNTLITGASSGLGAGMAREFAVMGRNLALCARRADRLESLRDELLGMNPEIRIAIRTLDVNDHARVFAVFGELRDELGSLDRIIVNAGIGKGQPLGSGRFDANLQTVETNFVAALAQCEAAMEIFRAQEHGHLVTISSMSALRGMPFNMTTYAASKAALRALSEGLRVEMLRTHSAIRISTILPGYIRSEINERVKNRPFLVDTETGCRAMIRAIEREKAEACVPAWPWVPIGFVLKRVPLWLIARSRI